MNKIIQDGRVYSKTAQAIVGKYALCASGPAPYYSGPITHINNELVSVDWTHPEKPRTTSNAHIKTHWLYIEEKKPLIIIKRI